jgi:Ca2+:H+ antiporter
MEYLDVKASRRGTLPDIVSGDEGDTEIKKEKRPSASAPKTRDYQEGRSSKASRAAERKLAKKAKKDKKKDKKKKHSKKTITEENGIELTESPTTILPSGADAVPAPRVGFAENTEVIANTTGQGVKKPSILPFARPAMPKLLSSNVFVNPQPHGGPALGPTRSNTTHELRRTNSMPDRLREVRITHGAMPLPAFSSRSSKAREASVRSERIAEDDEDDDAPMMSRTAAVTMLLISTGLVALCAEFLVDAIPAMTESSKVSQAFIGLIILPIVGNAAEHVTAVTVAAKNKMDLAIGVAVGSSIQIALFVTPLVVILGWCMNKGMSLYFNLFETVSLFVTAFVINFLILDGRSNYLEGTLLIAAYVIIA